MLRNVKYEEIKATLERHFNRRHVQRGVFVWMLEPEVKKCGKRSN
jgi:hypothetical protein